MPLYKVKSNICKDGKQYPLGSEIELSEGQAAKMPWCIERIPPQIDPILPESSVQTNSGEILGIAEIMPDHPCEGVQAEGLPEIAETEPKSPSQENNPLKATDTFKRKPLANLISKTRSGKKEK